MRLDGLGHGPRPPQAHFFLNGRSQGHLVGTRPLGQGLHGPDAQGYTDPIVEGLGSQIVRIGQGLKSGHRANPVTYFNTQSSDLVAIVHPQVQIDPVHGHHLLALLWAETMNLRSRQNPRVDPAVLGEDLGLLLQEGMGP